jgi:hypothetical protein
MSITSVIRRSLTPLVIASALVVGTGCGDDGNDKTATKPAVAKPAKGNAQAILIQTHVTIPDLKVPGDRAKVLAGSEIGDVAFCRGGTSRGEKGTPDSWLHIRTFQCPEGRLKIGFNPCCEGDTQTGDWGVMGGTGRFAGLTGSGRMTTKWASAKEGRETFKGTLRPARKG